MSLPPNPPPHGPPSASNAALRAGVAVLCAVLAFGSVALGIRRIQQERALARFAPPLSGSSQARGRDDQAHTGERWQLFDDALHDALPVSPASSVDEGGATPTLTDYVMLGGVRHIGLSGATQQKPADTLAQDEMRLQKKVFLVPVGTACIIRQLSLPGYTALVQIVGGPHDGETGIVYTAWIQRTDATGRKVRIDGRPTIVDQLQAEPYAQIVLDCQGADATPNQYP